MAPLLALLIAQSAFAAPSVPIDAGPATSYHRYATPLTALRLSAEVGPEVDPAVAMLLLELARPEAERRARRIGSRVTLEREGRHLVLSAAGPARSFDELVAILRGATGEPPLDGASLRRGKARAEDLILADLEQPGPRLRRALRRELYGEPQAAVERLHAATPDDLRRARRAIFRADRARLVLVADVPEPVLRSALDGWFGDATAADPPGPDATVVDAAEDTAVDARVQAHNRWAAIGYRVTADPAVLEVAARLVAARLARSTLRAGVAEAWHDAGGALVLLGAASPGDPVVDATAGITSLPTAGGESDSAVGRYLRRMVAEAAALAGPHAVAELATSLQREIALEARTPAGRAAVIGRMGGVYAASGDPVTAFLERLGLVDVDEVRALLLGTLESDAVVVEVRP